VLKFSRETRVVRRDKKSTAIQIKNWTLWVWKKTLVLVREYQKVKTVWIWAIGRLVASETPFKRLNSNEPKFYLCLHARIAARPTLRIRAWKSHFQWFEPQTKEEQKRKYQIRNAQRRNVQHDITTHNHILLSNSMKPTYDNSVRYPCAHFGPSRAEQLSRHFVHLGVLPTDLRAAMATLFYYSPQRYYAGVQQLTIV
jgi:hypothetical protein